MSKTSTDTLSQLFQSWKGIAPSQIEAITEGGSARQYFRLTTDNQSAIGCIGVSHAENEAFISFTKHLHSLDMQVPEIYAVSEDGMSYLQQDLGNRSLYKILHEGKSGQPSESLLNHYIKSLTQLGRIQIKGSKDIDFSKGYPTAVFDNQSIIWDCQSFKYQFLRPCAIAYDEQALENDFASLAEFLMEADNDYFMMRDFQSRNIIIDKGHPYFIDYQGGRRGALQYDVVSLLYQAKANLPNDVREFLLNRYLSDINLIKQVDKQEFKKYYYGFALARTIQVLGAYGLRGLYEGKAHFKESIPFALKNAAWLLDEANIPLEIKELRRCLEVCIALPQFQASTTRIGENSPLTVSISSFSYKINGYPEASPEHGGGFVFDCRFIHNPGRYAPYKKLTGRDQPVIDFFHAESGIKEFLVDVYDIVDKAVEKYINRGFEHISINFGCTGGQHRSVYSADATAKHLQEKYGVKTEVKHIVQEAKGWVN